MYPSFRPVLANLTQSLRSCCTFSNLCAGEPPSNEDPADSYPVVITRGDGTRALVVQDYAFAKYLGFLQVGLLNPFTAMMSLENGQ